jgi:CheY-like chemotaxis protein
MDAALAGKRILVVEDEYFVASELKKQLLRAQAEVVGPVADATAGCRLAEAEALDGAVIDVNLNGETSYMLADRLTAAGIPHLFVTGYDGSSLPEAYRATPRLTKPYAEAVMIATVSALCGQGDRE